MAAGFDRKVIPRFGLAGSRQTESLLMRTNEKITKQKTQSIRTSGSRYGFPLGAVGRALLLLAALSMEITAHGNHLERVADSPLRFPEVPGGFGYRMVDVLGLRFEEPVKLVFPPGDTNRIFVAEKEGRVVVVTNRAAPTRTVVLDMTASTVQGVEEGLLALTVHPHFAENGRMFLHRVAWATNSDAIVKFNQISEIRVNPNDPAEVVEPERVLIQQPWTTLSHLGGDLHFGPDGYLYGSFGDGFDAAVNTQQITRGFYSAVFRIDVDDRPGSLSPNPHPSVVGHYRIPPDNPYVGATQFFGLPVNPNEVRTEFWVVGLRNPFRFSVDPVTGELWIGDVGEYGYESVFRSVRGANHGWPYREGILNGTLYNYMPADFMVNPIYQYKPPYYGYSHDRGLCVIGGFIYRGTRFPLLAGAYILGDYTRGWLGFLRENAQGEAEIQGFRIYLPYISSLAADPVNGDVWVSELNQSRLWRLEQQDEFIGDPVPETLAETGAFSDLSTLTPASGVVPYEVVQPFWSDGARKQRWFALPHQTNQFEFRKDGSWEAPVGTVWIKHFDLELTNGVPNSVRRLETRFLVRQTNAVYGLTYRWDSATNATLVPDAGLDEDIVREIDGQTVVQRWHYPGRGECLTCHNGKAGLIPSFTTAQLNRGIELDGEWTHQIAALIAHGYLTNAPSNLRDLPALAAVQDESASLEWRVRSYLAVNCSYCHFPEGAGLGQFDTRLATPTAQAGLINGPLHNPRGNSTNRVIAPGDAAHSLLLQRLSMRGPGQMPPLASSVADREGADLIQAWIASLPAEPPPEPEVWLRSEVDGTELRLSATQPANRALQFESCPDLLSGDWILLDLLGTERIFPSQPRDVEFAVPIEDGRFYRLKSVAP